MRKKNPRSKAEKVIDAFGKFLHVCNMDMSVLDGEFEEIKEAILDLKKQNFLLGGF
ncbi:MAG: hypothetical protein ACOX2P_10245 [Bacillota bacterium]